jgi:hypothetical protein
MILELMESQKCQKIMPLNISYSGDEHDKDIAMAIYYAVDNGAKDQYVLWKEFSLNKMGNRLLNMLKSIMFCWFIAAGNNSFNVDEKYIIQ